MSDPAYFFALPRLINRARGRNAHRSEKHALETTAVGLFTHYVAYLFFFQLWLTNRLVGQQLLWIVPLTIFVWLFWINFIYLNSLVLRLLRALGLMRHLPQARAQGILIGIVITIFALRLAYAHGFAKMIGLIWLSAVILNQLAAAVLALSSTAER